jgi:hypothetical protein
MKLRRRRFLHLAAGTAVRDGDAVGVAGQIGVLIGLVSASNSLLTAKLTGNFSNLGRFLRRQRGGS